MPIKKEVSDHWTCATVVSRLAAMASKPGRYMSIENGPMADSSPSVMKIKNRFVRVDVMKATKVTFWFRSFVLPLSKNAARGPSFVDPMGSRIRSEERRGGKECVRPCGYWWSPVQ